MLVATWGTRTKKKGLKILFWPPPRIRSFLNEEFLRMRILCKLSLEKYETAAGTVLGTHLRVIFPIVIHIGVSTCNSALYIFLRHGTGG